MAAPPRRSQMLPRLNPASVEYWKAENQKLRERNQSLHRRLHKYKNFVATLQEDKRKFTFIHKGTRYEFPRILILARSHVLADAVGNSSTPTSNIPPPSDTDPGNPLYTLDTTDIFPDFDQTTFHIFLQMLSRFCIYKPESIEVSRIKQLWRISDYFEIPTLLLNEDELVGKIKEESMTTFQGIQKELDFALRYNWKALKDKCIEILKMKTGDLGGLTGSMRDAEIMALLDTFVIAERRKSGVADRDEDSVSGDGLDAIRWATPSENGNDTRDEDEKGGMDEIEVDDDDDAAFEETTTVMEILPESSH